MMLFVAQIVIFVCQLVAFQAGMEHAWGWGWIGAILIALVVSCLPLGGVFIGIMTFYGAYKGWDWEWWQALILAAPGIAISIALLVSGGVMGLFRRG